MLLAAGCSVRQPQVAAAPVSVELEVNTAADRAETAAQKAEAAAARIDAASARLEEGARRIEAAMAMLEGAAKTGWFNTFKMSKRVRSVSLSLKRSVVFDKLISILL